MFKFIQHAYSGRHASIQKDGASFRKRKRNGKQDRGFSWIWSNGDAPTSAPTYLRFTSLERLGGKAGGGDDEQLRCQKRPAASHKPDYTREQQKHL